MSWKNRIIGAIDRGEFTADDLDKSKGWDTCLIGELFSTMESSNPAYIAQLEKLGVNSYEANDDGNHFPTVVRENDFVAAIRLYNKYNPDDKIDLSTLTNIGSEMALKIVDEVKTRELVPWA